MTILSPNDGVFFERAEEENPEHVYKYTAEKLMEWAINDYEKKHGVRPASARIEPNAEGVETPEGYVTIVLSDENGHDLDYYTINLDTGTGVNSIFEEVNLPKTGNNAPQAACAAAGAAAMLVLGAYAAMKSGVLRKKETE